MEIVEIGPVRDEDDGENRDGKRTKSTGMPLVYRSREKGKTSDEKRSGT